MFSSRSKTRPIFNLFILFIMVSSVSALVLLASAGGTLFPTLTVAGESLNPRAVASHTAAADEVNDAWQRAREAGSYKFTADVTQKTIPLLLITNVGRAGKEDRFYLEGTTNSLEQQMELVLWSHGGGVLDLDSGVKVKVDRDKSMVRQGDGEWQESDNLTGLFAPAGDFMTFLTAARNITRQGIENRAGATFTRYTFRVDGPGFAAHVRDQLEQHLVERGELPPDATLDTPQIYADMTGTGELWVNVDGLPLRQIIHLEFPPQEDYRIVADITVDFSNYGDGEAIVSTGSDRPNTGAFAFGGLRFDFKAMSQTLLMAVTLVCLFILLSHPQSKKIYAAVVLAVIASMIVTPLMQSHQVVAFYQRQEARTGEQEERQRESQMAQDLHALVDEQDNDTVDSHVALAMIRSDDLTDSDRDDFTDVQELLLESDPRDAQSTPDIELGAAFAPHSLQADDGTDSDGDGLTDYEETLLGTSSSTEDVDFDGLADGVDTDDDSIADLLEVEGFDYDGQTWYTDPLEVDTNKDGIADGLEWYAADTHPTWDTDGDGLPDLFDRDNDGDGVPDSLDISPFQFGSDDGITPTVFDDETPFNLMIEGLTPHHPTYVEFQMRPVITDHLWYALNVLDWPQGDLAGQIQDVDGKTFYDVCIEQGGTNCTMTPDDNGDMRLVPMLEITFDGEESLANLPPQDILQDEYGVSIQKLNREGTQKAAYVPLQLTTDPKAGDAHVAFYAKMLYDPAASWGDAQSVRLAWVIQGLVDVCGYPEDPPSGYDSGWDWPPDPDSPPTDWPEDDPWPPAEYELYNGDQCQFYDSYNQTQIVQTYYDAWHLTGLNVRENAGTDIAAIFEDPAVDPEPLHDTALIQLVSGLQETLLVNRDCDEVSPVTGDCVGNGVRDLTVTAQPGDQTLAQRFDYTLNGGVSNEERWGISNTLRVQTYSYAHLDAAYANTTKHTTVSILDTYFSPHWQTSTPITPTLLFAREERFRASNLDLQGHSSAIQWDDGDSDGHAERFTLDLNADGGTPQQTIVGINWAPYRYDQTNGEWEPYPAEEYWDELKRIYGDIADPADSPEVAKGKLMIAQIFYMMLYTGQANVVNVGGASLMEGLPAKSDIVLQDSNIYFWAKTVGGTAFVFIINQIVMQRIQDQAEVVWKALGKLAATDELTLAGDIETTTLWRTIKAKAKALKSLIKKIINKLGMRGFASLALLAIAAVTVAIIAFTKWFLSGDPAAKVTAIVIGATLLLVFKVILPLKTVSNAVKVVKSAANIGTKSALKTVLGGASEILGATKVAGVIGLIIEVSVLLVVFLYTWFTEDIEWGSIAANTMITDLISGIVIAVVMFVLALTVVGAIIVAIIGVIDLLIMAACEGGDETACLIGGFVSILTEALGRLIYSGGISIDTERDDLLTVRSLDTDLVQPKLGLRAGNSIVYQSVVDTMIGHKPPDEKGLSLAWYSTDEIYTPDQLRATTFKYELDSEAVTVSAARNDEADAWRDVQAWYTWTHPFAGDAVFYWGWKRDELSSPAIPLQAGINITLPVYLNMGLALPSYDCWFGVCDTDNTVYSQNSSPLGNPLVYDVFPANFDQFYTLSGDSAGYTLAWGQHVTVTFDYLMDADGDGLISSEQGGPDPDDGAWDADSDGLPDPGELAFGSDPLDADSDDDGLTDLVEFRLETDPHNADTDSDGLTDQEEVDGWLLEYTAGESTRVTSDPGDRDTDGDGLSDQLERNLGAPYHPRVANPSPVALYAEISDADRYVRPADSFVYTATVRNELETDWWASGRITTTTPAELGSVSAVRGFLLPQNKQTVSRRTLTVGSGIGSQLVVINNAVTAGLFDPPDYSSVGEINYSDGFGVTVDNDLPTSRLIGCGFVAAGGVRVLGVDASDPTSYVSRVQVQIDDGDWFDATRDGDYWAFEWDVPTEEGPHTIRARATDGVGWDQSPDSEFIVYVDATPPQVATDLVEGQLLVAGRNRHGHWAIPTSGTATDPSVGMPASGVGGVELHLTPNGSGWQAATVLTSTTVSTWTLDYALPLFGAGKDGIADPTGVYTVAIRARDRVGNETASTDVVTRRIRVDNTPPIASLEMLDTVTTISRTIAIGGQVTDTGNVASGVAGLELALVPAEMIDAVKEPLLLLPLNEPPEAVLFQDQSGHGNDLVCWSGQCPASDAAGRYNTAAQFDGVNQYLDRAPIYLPATDYTLALWFNTTCADCGIFSTDRGREAADGHDRDLFLDGGKVCANVLGGGSVYETICTLEDTFADGNWHQVAHVVGAGVGGQQLFVDGELRVRGFAAQSQFVEQNGLNVGFSAAAAHPFLDGAVDELAIYDAALPLDQVAALYRGWESVSLAQPGATSTAWTHTIPPNIEGFFQIDLRPTDALGNRNDRRITWRKWRGEIDTLAPRVGITVTYSGAGDTAQTTYTGLAEDLNLTEVDFEFPCALEAADRHYYDTAFWNTWSNETNRLHRLTPSCTVAGFHSDDVVIRACDANGRCAAATPAQYVGYATACEQSSLSTCTGSEGEITSLNLFGDVERAGATVLLEDLGGPEGIAVDVTRRKMYWTDSHGHIGRANLDGSDLEYLRSSIGSASRMPIVLDVDGNKMYWGVRTQIWRANLDGSQAVKLLTISDSRRYVRWIAIDPAAGKLYWSEGDPFLTLAIWRADLVDGANAEQLLSAHWNQFMGALALDPGGDTLYWGEGTVIRRAGLADLASYESVASGIYVPRSISLIPEINGLYWMGHSFMYAAQLDGADRRQVGYMYMWPQELAAVQIPARVITTTDLALGMRDVPNLAVHGRNITYEITIENRGLLNATNVMLQDALPDGVSFVSSIPACTSDGGTPPTLSCDLGTIQDGELVTVTIVGSVGANAAGTLVNSVVVAADQGDHEPSNNTVTEKTVATPPPTIPTGYVANFLYVSDYYTKAILRYNLDDPGSWPTPDAPITVGRPGKLAIDPSGRKIYWIDRDNGTIRRADLDGSNIEIIPVPPGMKYAIALDPMRGKLYWIARGDAIQRANLDGSDVETVIPARSAWVARSGLAINTIVGEIYWAESVPGVIYRSDLNGEHIETLVTGIHRPFDVSLDVFDNRIYWRTNTQIQRAYLDGSGVETVRAVTGFGGFFGQPLHIDGLNTKLYWGGTEGPWCTMWQANLTGTSPVSITDGVWAEGLGTVYLPDPAFVDAYEPNDDFLQAAGIGIAGPFTATIFPTGDVDYYALPALTGQRVTIDLTDLPENYDLTLYRPDHTPAAESALGGTTPEHIVTEADQSGSWFVRVSGIVTSVTPYTLQAHTTFTHTYEPNDTFGQAAGIIPGTSITSTVYPDGDQDYYAFTASLDQRILIDLTKLPANYELALYRPDQTLAASSSHSGNAAEAIDILADQSGTWYARVYGAAFNARLLVPSAEFDASPYILGVVVASVTPDADEPNDDVDQATGLVAGVPITATLYPTGDTDYYTVTVAAGQQIVVDLYDLPEDFDLELYRPDRSLEQSSAQLGTTAERIVAIADQPGVWFVRVAGSTPSHREYSLQVTLVTFTPDAYEPNDTGIQATAIFTGTVFTATLTPIEDEDWYTFPTTGGQQIVLNLYDLTENLELALYRPDQTLAAESTLGGPNPEKIVFNADQAGDWLVRVSGAAVIPGGTYSPWPYSLEVALPELAYTHIQWAAHDEIARSEISGCDDVSCITYVLTDTYVTALALDSVNDQVYWTGYGPTTGTNQYGVWRANFDGSDAQRLVASTNPRGIALDLVHRHIYWTDTTSDTIQRADLDGSNVVTLTTPPGPTNIALDVEGGKLYWSQGWPEWGIWRANLADVNGTKTRFIISSTMGIALDLLHDKIYWTDSDFTNSWIHRANLSDGLNVQRIISETGYFQEIALDAPAGLMYWVDGDYPNKIQRATLDATDGITVVSGGGLSLRGSLALELGYPDVPIPEDLAPPTAMIETPAHLSTLVATDTVDVRGIALAPRYLQALTVTVNGSLLYTTTWESDAYTSSLWSTTWTPPDNGDYTLLAVAEDWAGTVQTDTMPVTVTVDISGTIPEPSEPPVPPGYVPRTVHSSIITPAHESILATLDPITVTGSVYADDFVQTLTVTVNGSSFYSDSWSIGTVTETRWSRLWTPPAEGTYILLSVIDDHAGRVQTDTQTVRVTVDVYSPTIAITQTVLTSTHRFASGRFDIPGLVTDTVGIETVEVQIDGGAWDAATVKAMVPGPWRYPWDLGLGNDPDGVGYTVSARARDVAGRIAQTTETITVDVVPPARVTMTLAYTDSLGVRHPISPGRTIYQAAPTLLIEWSESSDGGGLGGYLVGWTHAPTPDPAVLTGYAPGAARHHVHVAGEAETLYAHIIIYDVYGNRRQQTLGPVYVDAPTTPDVTTMGYRGWMESGATQIGADREITKGPLQYSDIGVVQRFYLTWDDATLRMAWDGANWDHNGDLFIYLDTASGGATALYNPYTTTATTTIGLPTDFAADQVLWIEDRSTASLLTWDGATWVISASLTTDHYQLRNDLTDLHLPFAMLGIDGTTSVGVLAVASEEDGLRLWATAPDKNPLNSKRVINPLALSRDLTDFELTQYYTWPSLALDVHPNAGRFADSDLGISISANPTGVVVGYLESDLLDLLSPGVRLDGDGDGVIDIELPLDVDPYPLHDGQTVTFTVHYSNTGPVTATNVVVTATASGVLSFASGSEAVIALGDIGPTISGTRMVTATVSATPGTPSAEMNAVIIDGTHRPYEWFWVQHDVDTDPPTVTIQSPRDYARPYTQTVTGAAQDASGVPLIALQVRALPGEAVTDLSCADSTPFDGQWMCLWNAGDMLGIDHFQIRAQATDSFGTPSDWTDWVTLAVDNTPPTVTVDRTLDDALVDGYMSADEARIDGQVVDDRQASRARRCTPGLSGLECALLSVRPGTTPTGTWSLEVTTEGADGITRTLVLYGYDKVGNRSEPLTRTFRVDAVAPVITITTPTSGTVLLPGSHHVSGLVSDGGEVTTVRVVIQAPNGDLSAEEATLNGTTWAFDLPTGTPDGTYLLWVEAVDAAGNVGIVGPFQITAAERYHIYLPLVLRRYTVFTGPSIYLPLVMRDY